MRRTILICGATGFVGRHLHSSLSLKRFFNPQEKIRDPNVKIVGATRNVQRARKSFPSREFVGLDVHECCGRNLKGFTHAYYLVHEIAEHEDYHQREINGAQRFAKAAKDAGVERIIYLGGVQPAPGQIVSEHLKARRDVGEALRNEHPNVVELRAGMIVGAGSASFEILKTLVARLPLMVIPRDLNHYSEPVSIQDMVYALNLALDEQHMMPGVYGCPGASRIQTKELFSEMAQMLKLPFVIEERAWLPANLASKLGSWVTHVEQSFVDALMEGLRSDLVCDENSIWSLAPQHPLLTYREMLEQALSCNSNTLLERGVRLMRQKAAPTEYAFKKLLGWI